MNSQKHHILEDFYKNTSITQDLGLEEQITTLNEVFTKVKKGSKELVLINGEVGTGKTWLLKRWQKELKTQRFEVIEGKFELFSHNIPYLAWTNAFQDWTTQLQTREEKEVYRLRQNILRNVGSAGQVLIDWMPSLEILLDKQPALPTLDDADKIKQRFYYVIKNFIRHLAQKQKPLIFFLNDWQWADQASLELLKIILQDELTQYLMFVLGHRDNTIEEDHPFYMYLQQAKGGLKADTKIYQLQLPLLSEKTIGESLKTYVSNNQDKNLANNLAKYTKGNPLFTALSIEYLLDESFSWEKKLRNLEKYDLQDFIYLKFQRLSQNTQEILTLGACWGNVFDMLVVQNTLNKTEKEISLAISEASQNNFIDVFEEKTDKQWLFRFNHPTLEESIYLKTENITRQKLHCQLANMGLNRYLDNNEVDMILAKSNQFLLGSCQISSENEILPVVRALLQAGKTTYLLSAFEISLKYIEKGIATLTSIPWEQEKELTYQLYLFACELCYMLDLEEQAEKYLQIILQNVDTLSDKIKAQELKINFLKNAKEHKKVVDLSLQVLESANISFPKKPSTWNTKIALWQFRLFLSGKKSEDFAYQQAIEDETMETVQRILLSIRRSVSVTNPKLLPFLTIAQMRLAVKYSHPAYAPLSYAMYAQFLLSNFDDVENALLFGQVAQKMIDRTPDMRTQARALFILNVYIRPWQEPLIKTLPALQKAHQIAYEVGDDSFVAFTMNLYLIHSFYLGENLQELEIHAHRFDHLLKGANQKSIYHNNLIIRQTLYNLLHSSEESYVLKGDIYDREKLLPKHQKAKHFTTIFTVYQMELMLSYLFDNYQYGMEILPEMEKTLSSVKGTINMPIYYYYRSLCELAYLEEKNFQSHEKVSLKPYLKKIEERQKKLKKWAKTAPNNFLHKYYLVEAEYNHVSGNEDKARTFFDKAISLAKKNRYLNDEALAWENAGKFYVKINQKSLAEIYIQKAVKAYQLWGISEKIKNLEKKYPKFVRRVLKQPLMNKEKSSLQTNPIAMHMIEEAQKIAAIQSTDSLWEEVIRFFLQETQAEKAYILSVAEDKIWVELGLQKTEEEVHLFNHTAIEQFHDLSNQTVILCQKSQETLLINDPARNHQFAEDEYVQNYQPKSVLCFPILKDKETKALIYLENNQKIAAFHTDKIDNLKMLLPFVRNMIK